MVLGSLGPVGKLFRHFQKGPRLLPWRAVVCDTKQVSLPRLLEWGCIERKLQHGLLKRHFHIFSGHPFNFNSLARCGAALPLSFIPGMLEGLGVRAYFHIPQVPICLMAFWWIAARFIRTWGSKHLELARA